MISSLHIKNYALINELTINFEKGFTIITGETGAGKSILLGALNLIAGQRADSTVLLDKQSKCIVEAEFDINNLNVKSFFDANDLDFNSKSIIRREISSNGKSRAFINDTPVNLSHLKELSQLLIDIHSQHQSIELNEKNTQLNYLDVVADNEIIVEEYKSKFSLYKQFLQQLQDKEDEEKRLRKDIDYYQFQWQEIEDLKLQPNEIQHIKNELSVISNAEEIKKNLLKVNYLLEQKEDTVIAQLNECKNALASIGRFNADFEELQLRLQSNIIELKDISSEIENQLEKVSFNPEKLEFLNERLSNTERLMRKHGVNLEEELLLLKNSFESKITGVYFIADAIEKTKKEIKTIEHTLKNDAQFIHKKRLNCVPKFEKEVCHLLQQLGMPNAQFIVKLNTLSQLNTYGQNEVEFLFSANKGIAPASLQKVASGGEISRVMLAIKSLIARQKTLPSIIFDEIDTGVSGDVAAKMAIILKELSKHLQVISITHLPQIASKGNHHWYVYKDNVNDTTTSHIKVLNNEERIHEIAKMLSNENMTSAAISNAKELLGLVGKKAKE
ncbi:MAG TPA: DNA repair protein RecN [Bacteroidia bacterium]|nr:DNA repair protein RecN [Bacteroidia bacterium]